MRILSDEFMLHTEKIIEKHICEIWIAYLYEKIGYPYDIKNFKFKIDVM